MTQNKTLIEKILMQALDEHSTYTEDFIEGMRFGIEAALQSEQAGVNEEMLRVLKELEESSSYWGEYDVPLGIHDRIKQAISNAEKLKENV